MPTRPALTDSYHLANARLYNRRDPEFNVKVRGSRTPSESESESGSGESDNPVTKIQQEKLDEILKRKTTAKYPIKYPIMPSANDDPQVQQEIISWRKQKRLSRLEREEKKGSMTPSGSDNRAKEDNKKSCPSVTTSTKFGSFEFGESDRLTEFSQESEQDAFSQEKQEEQASSSQQNTEQKPTQQSAPSGVPSNPNAQQPNQKLFVTKMSL